VIDYGPLEVVDLVGRHIVTTTAPVTRTDITNYDPATGTLTLGTAAPNLKADNQPCTGSGQNWTAPATVTTYPERALTGAERAYTPATGALTVSIPLKPGTPVTADGTPCTGSGADWVVTCHNEQVTTYTYNNKTGSVYTPGLSACNGVTADGVQLGGSSETWQLPVMKF
jgi:hypothetical protein